MPFTPFHAGLGIAAKALAPATVSLQAFTLTQITMDIEPGVQMLRDAEPLHGWTHTFPGALVVGVGTFALWRLVQGRRIYRWTVPQISSASLAISVLLGAWSHVALDAFIHHDMVSSRELLGLAQQAVQPHGFAEALCVGAALAGVLTLAYRWRREGIAKVWREIADNLARAPRWFTREK
jgi:hypothetical protein